MYAMEFHEKEILINAFTFKSFHAHYKRKILSFGLLYAGNVCKALIPTKQDIDYSTLNL